MLAFLALGSNLGDRFAWLRSGVNALAGALEVSLVSSVWETEPVGGDPDLWFLNMAIGGTFDGTPLELLGVAQRIEAEHGRRRGAPNAPRTLDVDLLWTSAPPVDHPRLVLPHERMWDRRFVLEPLAEIAPHLVRPETGRTVVEELSTLPPGEAVYRLGHLGILRRRPGRVVSHAVTRAR